MYRICIFCNILIILSQNKGHEQRAYISSIKDSAQEEIFIKKTGWEEISLSGHSHNKHQIIYTLSGTLHVQIGSTSYFVPEKHIGWIPKNVEHELCSKNRQVSLVIYYVDWAEEAHRPSCTEFSIYAINAMIAENLKYIASKGTKIEYALAPELYEFTLSFFRLLPSMCPASGIWLKTLVVPNDMRLHPILDYMMEHLGDGLRIDRVAAEFGFSVRNLSRLLHASGIRFADYMNHQRVVRAIELFSDGGRTLQQVAYEAGFSTPNHFNRVFRQVTGMSPGVFFGKNRLRDR